jgi:hypothetical protein
VRKWKIVYPDEVRGHVEEVLTDEEILDTYYTWWSGEMLRVHKAPMITEEMCIQDWVVVHWAWEVE